MHAVLITLYFLYYSIITIRNNFINYKWMLHKIIMWNVSINSWQIGLDIVPWQATLHSETYYTAQLDYKSESTLLLSSLQKYLLTFKNKATCQHMHSIKTLCHNRNLQNQSSVDFSLTAHTFITILSVTRNHNIQFRINVFGTSNFVFTKILLILGWNLYRPPSYNNIIII